MPSLIISATSAVGIFSPEVLPPANTLAPVVSGSATVGSTLSCSTGTWANSPTSYSYQWLRDGSPISGATSATYQLQVADEGADISCVVTAMNAAGSGSPAVSNEVGPVEEAGEGYLYDTSFAGATLRSYSDETVNLDGVNWYCWTGGGPVELVADAGSPTGREFRFGFSAGSGDDSVGLVTSSAYSGAGKKQHCAILLKYTGFSSFDSAIKKTMRFLNRVAGPGESSIVGTLNAQWGVWRIDNEPGVVDQSEESAATHGPATFINQYRWLEVMMDFSTPGYCEVGVWVDGTRVINATIESSLAYPSANVDGTYISTTFNSPSATGTDHIARIIFHDDFIGIPQDHPQNKPDYEPIFAWSAAGGTPGNVVTGWQEVMSSRVRYSSDRAGPSGALVTAKQEVLANSNWFGGWLMNNISSLGIGPGDDIWIRQYLYFPSDYQFACGSVSGDRWGNVKWIRLQFANSEQSRNTLQMGNLAGTGFASTPSHSTQVGWGGFTDEYGGGGYNGDVSSPGAQVTRGQWLAIQSHVRLASNTTGYVESWINDTYVGRALKNGQSSYQTMSNSTLNAIVFGDYWNGGPGFDGHFFVDEIIITTETPNTLDLDGRPFISPAHFVEDFA